MAVLEQETWSDYLAIPVRGLSGRGAIPFPLYLATGTGSRVLYQPADQEFVDKNQVRLEMEGVDTLYIRGEDRADYARRVEDNLSVILRDRSVAVAKRAEILHEVSIQVADDLFAAAPEQPTIHRARNVMASTASLVLRDARAFAAIRRVLRAGDELATHSLTVGLLSIGLAHHVLGSDPNLLLRAGMAGLLHDIGYLVTPGGVRNPGDPEHTERGYRLLKDVGLPDDICQAALCHHERFDGSGYPRGLTADRIPVLARIVGLTNAFHRIYNEQANSGPTGTFESLRALAETYRDCFDTGMMQSLVRMFAS